MSHKLKPLTHNEALAEVYRLTPQLRDYDEFMYLGVRWLPYTMYFHLQNYGSSVINTDAFGFRFNDGRGGRYSLANLPKDRPINLLVGGSTALGTGTTRDDHTVSSYLSAQTGETWINFAGRGYNSTQELIMFLMHRHRFENINNVVLLSGLNTLTLEGLPDKLASEHGRYYYSYEFSHYMEAYNQDLRRRKQSYASGAEKSHGLLQRIMHRLRAIVDQTNASETVLSDEGIDTNVRIDRAAWVVTNTLGQWKDLLAASGAKLHYVLQPVSYWTKDSFHEDELKMFHAIDCCANNFWRLFGKLLSPDLHGRYSSGIRTGAEKLGVPYWDMNELLRTSEVNKGNVYVDHLHFNDAGYEEMGRIIKERVIHA